MGGSSPFGLPCFCCFHAEGSSSASHECELFHTTGCQRISSFFCKSVSTLISVDAFMTWEPIQLYIPAALMQLRT